MNRLAKFLIIVAGGVIVFSVALVFILFTVINPNRYRGTLENLVAQQSGLQLSIAGDMSWQFWPVFGIGIDDVRLRNPDSPQELASFSRISLRLDPAGLLRGQLNMQELLAENLHVNWIVDRNGNSNWPVGREQPASTNAPANTSPNEVPVAVNIEQITLSNASFLIQDHQRDLHADIRNINLSSRNTNLDYQPFPLSLSMNLNDAGSGRTLPLSLETTARVDINAGNLQLDDLELSFSPLQVTGQIQVRDFLNALSWQVNLSSNRFPLPHLLANFADQEPDLPPPNQQQVAVQQLDAQGDLQRIRVNTLALELGNNERTDRVELDADIVLAADNRPLQLNYNLRSQQLDVDAWLPESAPQSPETAAEPTPEAENAQIAAFLESQIPVDLLASVNVRGSHAIGDLRIGGIQFVPANFELALENRLLVVNTQSIGFYGGEIDMQAQLNARTSPPQLTLNSGLSNINASALPAELPWLRFFDGRFDVISDHQLAGNTVGEMLNSISGSSQMQVSESVVDINMLKQVFSAISVLSPNGDLAAQWPDRLQISNTLAALNFSNGLSAHDLNIRLDNFDIAGSGGIDLLNSRFDYQMAFTVLGEPAPQSIVINEDFQNIAWPVRCNAAFSDSPARFCSPDLQRVREMFAEIARGEIERRASEAVGEQIENVRNRIRNLLQ